MSVIRPSSPTNLQGVGKLYVHVARVPMVSRGGSRIFFRRGCTRLLLYFNTNKPHSSFFFCRIPVVLENRRSSQGGVRTPCTLPLDPPLYLQLDLIASSYFSFTSGFLQRRLWFVFFKEHLTENVYLMQLM